MTEESPLEIKKHREGSEVWYSITFEPDAIPRLSRALVKEGRSVNGYAIEAVMMALSEIGDPAWGDLLDFDPEADLFCVRCPKRSPLEHLVRRLEKRLANPGALRRLVRNAPLGF